MTNPIISVQNLGKRYRLGQRSNERYVALRDVLTQKARGIFRRRRSGQSLENENEIWALRGVTFEVTRGEVIGIIGRNGAGKSTLLKILSRITEPTEGQARIMGRVASLLEVGTGFHPELTGRENVFLNGAILGMTRAEIKTKFDEIIEFAGIEKFLATPVKRFSSGMYVRLAFAVAAHLEPEILVIDEVLAVGDAEFQNKCLDKMQDVSRSGRTILFVSHNLAAVNALCDRAIVLRAGCIDFDGVASKASEHYMAGILSDREHGSQKNGHIVRGNGFTIHAPNVDFVKNANNESDFLLTFEVEADEPRTYIRFGVALKTVTGILIARLSHRVTKFVIRRIEDRIRIQIRFKEISRYLAGGHYVLDAWLSVPDAEILLFAEGIAELHLPPGDPFGVGGEFKYPKSGLVPLPASFDLLDENSSHP